MRWSSGPFASIRVHSRLGFVFAFIRVNSRLIFSFAFLCALGVLCGKSFFALAQSPETARPAPPHPAFLVVIDPAHGGDDFGARLGDGLVEKDLTLSLARRLKNDLVERGIAARMLRETDTSLSLDERAEISNQQRASVFVSLHVGAPGAGVRVYAPVLASPPPPAAGRFLPWEGAQAAQLARSRSLAQAVATELTRRDARAALLSSPLRPLNNVTACAIAVELVDGGTPGGPASPKFQGAVAAGIASAIVRMRPQMEGQP